MIPMLIPAVRQILFSEKTKKLVDISGERGLVYDAAGGALTNGRTGSANIMQGNNVLRAVVAGETRYSNARRLHNYVVDYNNFGTANWVREGTNTASGDTINFAQAGDQNTNRLRQAISLGDDRSNRFFMVVCEVATSDQWSDPTALLTISFGAVSVFGEPTTITFDGSKTTNSSLKKRAAICRVASSGSGLTLIIYSNKPCIVPGVKIGLFDVTGYYGSPYAPDFSWTNVSKYTEYTNQIKAISGWGDSVIGTNSIDVIGWFRRYYGLNHTSAGLDDWHSYSGQSSSYVKTQFLAASSQHSDKVIVIWVGHNAFNRTTVKSDIAAMVADLSHTRYVIVSLINGTANPVGVGYYAEMMACNADLAALYPGHYVDVRAALIAAYDPGTPQDVTDVANDIVPSTLRADAIHLNAKGNYIAANTIFEYIINQGMLAGSLTKSYTSAILHEPATTNLATSPRDFTNAAWVKNNITPAKDAEGINGATNQASTLTATADNGTALQTITSASSQRTTGCFIKRKTGTGTINMTQDNGSTWTPVTVTSSWTLVQLSAVTSADPVFGLQIVTSGDAIYVDYFQHELGSYLTSPISGSRAADSIKLPYSANINFRHDKGIVILKLRMKYANSAGNKSLFSANTGATDFIYDNGSGGIALGDGANTATAAVGGWAANDILLIGACYDDKAGKMSIHVSKNGGSWIDSSDTTYDGGFSTGTNIVLCSGNTDTIEIQSNKIFKTNKSFSAMQRWIKARAVVEV